MARHAPLLFILFFSLPVVAQQVIKGRVVHESSGMPVAGSSVFITNTSKGTTSAADGTFELSDIPPGKHELIISFVGYETNVYSFSTDQLPLLLRVEMKIKVQELKNVTVEPYVEEGWDKWGKTFTENFIGATENADRCVIRNKDVIKFRYYRKSNRLVAYADAPLKIENKALGYFITYQLEDFEVDFKNRSSVFMGYSLFEERKQERKIWNRRRNEALHGSLMHFMRCLYQDSLEQNGYEVRRMVRTRNTEKDRVKKIYAPLRINTILGPNTIRTEHTGGTPEDVSPDSMAYYQRVIRQDDYIDTYGKDLLTADSLITVKDGVYKMLYFTDYLFITYKKELEQERYVKNTFSQSKKPSFQRSWIYLPASQPVWIEPNGNYFNPQNLFTMGYLGWADKMADNLPLDFEPEK